MKRQAGDIAVFLVALFVVFQASAYAQGDPAFGYALQRDIVYGQGIIAPDGKKVERDLRLDLYSPAKECGKPCPAVVYVHGGAHHRGGRMQPPFRLDGAVHSRPEDYARLLAPLGYSVFVVEYRLAPENPEPELKPGDANTVADLKAFITPTVFEATTRARAAAGLKPLTTEADRLWLWKAGLAGAEDVKKAVDFIFRNAAKFNVDPARVALGGHSAGGGITLNVALGLRAPVAAIFPLSGPDIAFDHAAVAKFEKLPPTLLVYSQYDEHAQLEGLPGLVKLMKNADVDYEFAWVPGFPHFYPHNAPSLGDDGTRMSVGERIIRFLERTVGKDK
ncbi:MAG: alpha/beta hydrolase [Hyphomicrobiaceae bacterium]|nr:alpha/beta hydrolase [Hyphomicrobiaceae bacterium]